MSHTQYCGGCRHANHGTDDAAEGLWACPWIGAVDPESPCRVRYGDDGTAAYEPYDGRNGTWVSAGNSYRVIPWGYENRKVVVVETVGSDEPYEFGTCLRCRRDIPWSELKPLSWSACLLGSPLWLFILLHNSSAFWTESRGNYCRPCRRSVQVALFFVGFVTLTFATVLLIPDLLTKKLPQWLAPLMGLIADCDRIDGVAITVRLCSFPSELRGPWEAL